MATRDASTPSYLRLSVTDACNFRCQYCRPQGQPAAAPRGVPLSLSEIARLVEAMALFGVEKVRLTGGEPGLRSDLVSIAERVAQTPGIAQVALTTNGTALRPAVGQTSFSRAKELHAAGIGALNVSIDSLRPDVFARVTGGGNLAPVLEGIDMALAAGFESVKINAVVMKGVNAGELDLWLDYVRKRPVTVRFIELMPTRGSAGILHERFSPLTSVAAELTMGDWHERDPAPLAGPAREFEHRSFLGRLGLIMPVSSPFCSQCNRLRMDSQGCLHLCAFNETALPLRHLLQSSLQRQELLAALQEQVLRKKILHKDARSAGTCSQDFSSLGG